MIRPISVLLVCAALAAASPAPAHGPDGESDVASSLRSWIEAVMDGTAAGPAEDVEIFYAIDLDEDAEGRVSVVVRDIIALSGRDVAWEIGDWTLDLVPDGPDRYRATGRLPSSTSFHGGGTAVLGGTSLGDQRCVGTYVPSVRSWPEIDCAFADFVVRAHVSDDRAFRLSVDRTTIASSLREDQAGKWSGPVSMDVEGVRLGVNGEDALGLARFDIDVAYGDWDLVFLAALDDAFREMQDEFDETGAIDQGRAKEVAAGLSALAKERAPLMESTSTTIALTDFHVRPPDSSGIFGFDALSFGMGAAGLDANAGSAFLEYRHDGLVGPASGAEAELTPHALDLRLTLDGLPVLDLALLAMDAIGAALKDSAAFRAPDDSIRAFAALALQRVLRAESGLAIERLDYESPALRASLAGRFAASARSPLMAVGTARLEAAGLSGLAERLESMAASGDSGARDALRILTVVRAVGQRVGEGDDARRVYDIELAEDGGALLNGADVGPLLEGLAP